MDRYYVRALSASWCPFAVLALAVVWNLVAMTSSAPASGPAAVSNNNVICDHNRMMYLIGTCSKRSLSDDLRAPFDYSVSADSTEKSGKWAAASIEGLSQTGHIRRTLSDAALSSSSSSSVLGDSSFYEDIIRTLDEMESDGERRVRERRHLPPIGLIRMIVERCCRIGCSDDMLKNLCPYGRG